MIRRGDSPPEILGYRFIGQHIHAIAKDIVDRLTARKSRVPRSERGTRPYRSRLCRLATIIKISIKCVIHSFLVIIGIEIAYDKSGIVARYLLHLAHIQARSLGPGKFSLMVEMSRKIEKDFARFLILQFHPYGNSPHGRIERQPRSSRVLGQEELSLVEQSELVGLIHDGGVRPRPIIYGRTGSPRMSGVSVTQQLLNIGQHIDAVLLQPYHIVVVIDYVFHHIGLTHIPSLFAGIGIIFSPYIIRTHFVHGRSHEHRGKTAAYQQS